ncbi:histidine phosphatase family protein [Agrococcus jejuensis]|uniref:histidine phosphatase family protein n=1 Tax=Agrococcus jejuensis TaxID=399736 RepID=UPI0011A26136|nr:histidine phosphatase family protein [Agrococcus jejuensis]
MQIALVRHGQTDWNKTLRMQGTSDIPLNETGRGQALEAAVLLSDEHWDAIVSSTLSRAAVTADIIAERLGMPVLERDVALIERAYGEVEGLTKAQATERFGTEWPGEESYEALQARAVAAVDAVATRHAVEHLVIVTHGTFIRAFADAVTGLETRTPRNAESIRFEGEPGAWVPSEGMVLV